jgi:cobalt-zinc-cadmium efflux system outer membrane protein
MSIRELLACCVVVSLSGCLYHARERADGTIANIVSQPYDMSPAAGAPPAAPPTEPPKLPPPPQGGKPYENSTGDQTSAPKGSAVPSAQIDVQTSKYLLTGYEAEVPPQGERKFEPKIPAELPGAEARPIVIPKEEEAKDRAIKQLFPKLPPLTPEPTLAPGPGGRAYTLADLQLIAAGNSPELRQAAADVEAARGNVIQARAYPNPTTGWEITPSNDGSAPGAQGPFVDQVVKTMGKLKIASAAAEMDLQNSQLALRKARSDLATRVRAAYYGLLVAKETSRVNRALAQFTDQIYQLHTGLLEAGNAASYEPMALRAQAYSVRLAYEQSVQTYFYAWKQLVATIGLRQLPLSQVEGRIDAFVPYFDYDTVLGYVLRNHTDVLTARNTLDKARFQLKLAQVTPVPDVEFNVAILKEYVVEPKAWVPTATIGFPLPLWDQNKGNIMAAEAGLVRATEESHRIEMNLTETLATNYTAYRTNLQSLDYFRNHILPDAVRAYRGVLERRQLDPNAAFSDLFGAQQALAGFVTTYVGVLNTLWTSAVNVADLLQTDDLFALAQPQAVPSLPDLGTLLPFPCCHPSADCEALPMGAASFGAATSVPRPAVVAASPIARPARPGQATSVSDLANADVESIANFGAEPVAGTPVPNAAANPPTPASPQNAEKPQPAVVPAIHTSN